MFPNVARRSTSGAHFVVSALLVLLVWAMQIQRVHAGNTIESVSAIVVSCDDARWDAADPRLPDSANNELGWAALFSFERANSRTDVDRITLDAAPPHPNAAQPAWSNTHRALLAARPSIDAVKHGRDAARATTVPPPAV